jgi:cytochrome c peroxidase
MPYMHNGKFATLGKALSHYEELAKGIIHLGAGGGSKDDLKNVVEFLKALTGTQVQSPAAGVAPPALK